MAANLSRSGADATVRSNVRVRKFANTLLHAVLDAMRFTKYIAPGEQAVIRENDSLVNQAGDQYIFYLSKPITGNPVLNDDEREGKDAQMNVFDDSVYISNMFKSVTLVGEMEEQRVAYNLRKDARFQLKTYFADKMHEYIVDHLSGNADMDIADGDATDVFPRGHAPTTATSQKRLVIAASGSHTWTGTTGIDGSGELVAADKLLVEDIIIGQYNAYNPASGYLKTPPIADGDAEKYLWLVEPAALYWLQRDPDYQQILREGALRGNKNPLFTGALIDIHGNILVKDEKLRRLTNGTVLCSVSVLLGRNAAILAKADRSTKWKEKYFDWDNKFGVGASIKWGIKKVVFDSQDYGTYTVLSASPAPARSEV